MAPTGSSIRIASHSRTANTTMMPATNPMMSAALTVTNAQGAVATTSNTWNMATRSFADVITEFSTDRTTWTTTPVTAVGYRYVRVTAPNNSIGIYFLSSIGLASSLRIAARSTAGIEPPTTYGQGVFPFAPLAHHHAPPNFGYNRGDQLTLLWPSSVGSNGPVKLNNLCASDRSQAALSAVQDGTTADRGYIQDTSASAIAAAIEDDHMDYTVTLNLPVNRTGGVKGTDVNQSLANRVAQDTLSNVDNYDAYVSAHDSTPKRRVVVVPIIGDATNSVVVGFANVFLPSSQPRNPNDAKCGTYIGPTSDANTSNQANGSNIVRILE